MRYEKDTKIEKLVKNVRNTKIMLKNTDLLNKYDKFVVQYDQKNIIKLDEENNRDSNILSSSTNILMLDEEKGIPRTGSRARRSISGDCEPCERK